MSWASHGERKPVAREPGRGSDEKWSGLHEIPLAGRSSDGGISFEACFANGAIGADNFDRWVTVHNKTGFTLVRFHASNVDEGDYQEDILGPDILRSGSSVRINMDDGTGYCRYDFLAVFEDGEELRENGVNVCEVGTYTYH